MRRNGRKLQILRLLTEKALSVDEIADASAISKKSAAMCVLRYRRQGLIAAKIAAKYYTTVRGLARIDYIKNQSVFGGTPSPIR